MLSEGKQKPFTPRNIRFTTKGDALYAITLGRPEGVPGNPTMSSVQSVAQDFRPVVLKPVRKDRQPAITELRPLQQMIQAAGEIMRGRSRVSALRLRALTAVRPSDLRGAHYAHRCEAVCVHAKTKFATAAPAFPAGAFISAA